MKAAKCLVFTAFLLAMVLGSQAFADTTGWITNLDEAKAKAKAENKNIFISFSGSDW